MFDLASVKSSRHGRERRQQRQIDKGDAKLARQYGIVELSHQPHDRHGGGVRKKYTFRGTVFVLSSNQEITCYHSPDYASAFSGTRVALPVLYELEDRYTSQAAIERHLALKRRLRKPSRLRRPVSHTVFCVSMSSLMRQDDVNGARCRSDAVWAALARGHIRELAIRRQEQRKRRSSDGAHESSDSSVGDDDSDDECSLVSAVALLDSTFKVVLQHEPVDLVVYNRVLSFRDDWATLRPHGNAIVGAALVEVVQSLFLSRIDQSLPFSDPNSAAVHHNALVFVGSDDLTLADDLSECGRGLLHFTTLAERCGQLRVSAIALGHESDSVSTLRRLLEIFEGCDGSISCELKRSSLDLDALIQTVSDCSIPMRSKNLRTRATTVKAEENWIVGAISKVFAWSELANDMCPLVDRRCASCWAYTMPINASTVSSSPNEGWLCASCESQYYCVDCVNSFTLHLGSSECARLQREYQAGRILSPSKLRIQDFPSSYRIEIERVSSASTIIFAGQKIRFLLHQTSRASSHLPGTGEDQPFEAVMVSHRIGHGHWENVEPTIKRHYGLVCEAHLIAGRASAAFAERIVNLAASASPLQTPGFRLKLLKVQPAVIVEVEGGGGCYFVAEKDGQSARKISLNDLGRDDSGIIEAFSHYAIQSYGHPILVSRVIASEAENEILLTDLLVYHNDVEKRQAMEAFFRSHSCNGICRALDLRAA